MKASSMISALVLAALIAGSSSCVGMKIDNAGRDAHPEDEYHIWVKQLPPRQCRRYIDEYINTARESLINNGKDLSVFPSPSVYLSFIETNTFVVVSYSHDVGDLEAYVRLDLKGNVIDHFYGYLIGGTSSWSMEIQPDDEK